MVFDLYVFFVLCGLNVWCLVFVFFVVCYVYSGVLCGKVDGLGKVERIELCVVDWMCVVVW